MIKQLLNIGFLILVSFSCSTNVSVNSGDAENQVESQEVSIRVTETSAYCGGAKPSQEILDELNTPKSLPKTTIYLRKGEVNDVEQSIDYALKSDEKGLINVMLPAGKYSIVFDNKKDQSKYEELLDQYGKPTDAYKAIDTNCLQTYFRKPEKVIHVERSAENEFSVNYRNRCSWGSVPCAIYIGPIPPSAPPRK